ncbi:GNAT family N-acetyltransferase [Faunimonas sp. B44]|uniref:GNAT family N-acetyltransferase n=1 Tax=Faunimonas sp. B44 TaxID=3461493 RepID=UPI004044E355
MELRTARLLLRPIRAEDAPALHAIENDWEVVRMLAAVPWPLSVAAVEAFAARPAAERESDNFVLVANGFAVGAAGVKRPGSGDPPREMPRLGYWVGRAFQGRGYAGEAVAAVTAWAFERWDAHRVGAGVFVDNPASLRVLEKLGFREVRRYDTPSLSRGVPIRTIDMQVTRADFETAAR